MGVGADAGVRVLGGFVIGPSGFKFAVVSHGGYEPGVRGFPGARCQAFGTLPTGSGLFSMLFQREPMSIMRKMTKATPLRMLRTA